MDCDALGIEWRGDVLHAMAWPFDTQIKAEDAANDRCRVLANSKDLLDLLTSPLCFDGLVAEGRGRPVPEALPCVLLRCRCVCLALSRLLYSSQMPNSFRAIHRNCPD
jgi:hypothetical protein